MIYKESLGVYSGTPEYKTHNDLTTEKYILGVAWWYKCLLAKVGTQRYLEGRGGGLAVGVLDYCSDGPNSILTDCHFFQYNCTVLSEEKNGPRWSAPLLSTPKV